ncbi:DUF4214 domain-containing protein [Burkholderia cenocepacia]|uniref:DUF4214 domain-containing protein n=1 Tax=Burkholderia cenocepacia TaxID=95486 RepID=UPI00209AB89F|nr:DUF4214 domain-containing protein [Burkholderia cenocepacia]
MAQISNAFDNLNDYYQKFVLPIIRVITSPSLSEILAAVTANESKPKGTEIAMPEMAPVENKVTSLTTPSLSVKFTEFLNLDPHFFTEIEYLSGRRELIPVVKSAYDESDLRNLLKLHDADFIHAVYWVLLRRAADPDGLRHYTDLLRAGIAKADILERLRISGEAKGNKIPFEALDAYLRKGKIFRTPLMRLLISILPIRNEFVGKVQSRVTENSLYLINKKLYS